MRSKQEMFELIINTARNDDRIRAVILNGSRANPNSLQDFFQDYDIVYIVTDVASLKQEPDWIRCFGELMILQLPDDMGEPTLTKHYDYAYLMQFLDGNRIDLTLYPAAKLDKLEEDSLSIILLDKDGIIPPFPPSNDSGYLPRPPTPKQFAECCNEFWWVSTYVAKGLWRDEIIYAKCMFDDVVREELIRMLIWYIGLKTQFRKNPGKLGKYFEKFLEPELWELLLKTYAGAGYEDTWDALLVIGDLFRITAISVAEQFGFEYPFGDDQRVSTHLNHVRFLPKNAKEMY
jgi:aminoglycoside 6-adenylyltransferase